MRTKRSIINLITALVSQIVIMILAFFVPRLTLVNYGSETNGYMSLVTQIYAYINILEAGLGTAVVQALYAPVSNNDLDLISKIINVARKYYHRIAIFYSVAVMIVGCAIPFVVVCSLSKIEMFFYFILYGVSNVINFWFTASMRPLLLAEGKNYINSNITMVFSVLSQLCKIALLTCGCGIVFLQLGYSLINTMQIIAYAVYFKTKYKWIDDSIIGDDSLIRQRGAFFTQQISNLIFGCTDIVLITLLCDLTTASIYAVYNFIFNSISVILSMVTSSTQFVLGQTYNEDKIRYLRVHRTYESLLLSITFTIISTAVVMSIPFIKLYTNGVSDANYVDLILPIMFGLTGLLSTCKSTSLCLINFSFHAKETMTRTIIEALINLILSLIFIPIWGIHGALIGTTIALIYRVIDIVLYVNRRILKDSIFDPIKLYASNFVCFICFIYICNRINVTCVSYWEFFVKTSIIFCFSLIIYMGLNTVINMSLYKKIFVELRLKMKGK